MHIPLLSKVFARQFQNRLCSDLTNFKLVRATGAFASLPSARAKADCLVPLVYHFSIHNTITCCWSNTILFMIFFFAQSSQSSVCYLRKIVTAIIPVRAEHDTQFGALFFLGSTSCVKKSSGKLLGTFFFFFLSLTFSDPCDDLN